MFHEVQRETLQVCPANASAEAAAHPTLEHRRKLEGNTSVSGQRESQSAGATEPASPPKAKAKTLMTETPSFTVAMTPLATTLSGATLPAPTTSLPSPCYPAAPKRREAVKMEIEEHWPKRTKFGSWRKEFLKRSIEFIMLSQRSNGVDWRSGDCEKCG